MAGYLHCDLKPDNILIGQNKQCIDQTMRVRLIDFGISKKFLDDEANHVKNTKQNTLRGSIQFTSLEVLCKQTPSRRDDLKSLVYLILFMLEDNPFSQSNSINYTNVFILFKHNLELKTKYNCKKLQSHPSLKFLSRFIGEIWKLKFDEEPNYNKLHFILACALLDLN